MDFASEEIFKIRQQFFHDHSILQAQEDQLIDSIKTNFDQDVKKLESWKSALSSSEFKLKEAINLQNGLLQQPPSDVRLEKYNNKVLDYLKETIICIDFDNLPDKNIFE